MAEKKVAKKTSTGLPKNAASALCYAAGWVSGLIFLLIEKEDKEIRFHAMQSIVVFGGLTIVAMVPLIGWILSPFVMILGFILWLVCIVKAYQGEKFELPVVGEFAKKTVGKDK
jgi:uncharacterized membrane protein